MTQHLDLDALQAAVEARNLAGAYFAAVAFNWSQQIGHTLTSDDCMMLDKLRREWDAHADSTAYLIDRLRKAEAAREAWITREEAIGMVATGLPTADLIKQAFGLGAALRLNNFSPDNLLCIARSKSISAMANALANVARALKAGERTVFAAPTADSEGANI